MHKISSFAGNFFIWGYANNKRLRNAGIEEQKEQWLNKQEMVRQFCDLYFAEYFKQGSPYFDFNAIL
jgi:hypothetical protein